MIHQRGLKKLQHHNGAKDGIENVSNWIVEDEEEPSFNAFPLETSDDSESVATGKPEYKVLWVSVGWELQDGLKGL